MEDITKALFLWREHKDSAEKLELNCPLIYQFVCPWCKSRIIMNAVESKYDSFSVKYKEELKCHFCGWYLNFYSIESIDTGKKIEDLFNLAILRKFDVNSPKVALSELGTHLKKYFSDIYNIDWRRFEQLVSDIFKRHGFRTVLTQSTRDNGADIILLDNNDDVSAIVECKKYARNRKIGISLVRSIVGVSVDWEIKRAFIVTTSDFSSQAIQKALDFRTKGFEIELVNASDMLKMLRIYNEKLPPIHLMKK